jgi:starch synthase
MLDSLKTADYEGFIKTGIQYADATTNADVGTSSDYKQLIEELSKNNDIKSIKQDENFEESYFNLYNELVGEE